MCAQKGCALGREFTDFGGTLTVTENTRLADGIYRLRLAGDTSAITAPGQFVNLKLSGFFLRRPISVCDWENGELTLIYKSWATAPRP